MENKIKELKNTNLISKEIKQVEQRSMYNITLTWDYNDADYTTAEESFDKKTFENDLCLQLLLIYFQENGSHVDDLDNSMTEYLVEYGLMGYSDWGSAHSIDHIEIEYIDENGTIFNVHLNRPDNLTDEEIVEACDQLVSELE